MIEFCAITTNDGAFGILIFACQVNTGSVAKCPAETFRFPSGIFSSVNLQQLTIQEKILKVFMKRFSDVINVK